MGEGGQKLEKRRAAAKELRRAAEAVTLVRARMGQVGAPLRRTSRERVGGRSTTYAKSVTLSHKIPFFLCGYEGVSRSDRCPKWANHESKG